MINGQNNLTKILLITAFLLTSVKIPAQIFLQEGFEGGARPDGWTEENVSGAEPWRYRNGGHSPNDNNWLVPPAQSDITRNPPSANEGTFNAIFFKQGDNNERTKLVSPELNLMGSSSVELSFDLCQIPWTFEGSTGWDILRVYYKTSAEGNWVLLKEYLDPVYEWERKTLVLPNTSSSYYIAFEGQTRWGYGTCIDDIVVEEKGSQALYVGEIDFNQPFIPDIPSGSKDVPLLRIDFKIFGNTGSATLENIGFKSLNTDDNDISANGVKLFATTTQTFNTDHPIGIPGNFSGGTAEFNGLNHDLPPGISYLWLVYDIAPDAGHGNSLDVMVAQNSIRVNGMSYPETNASPPGNLIIHETRYFEDFEGIHNWTLSGEFEVAIPKGMGGSPGNPDPSEAFSGSMALGTDLTGLGTNPYNYEAGVNEASAYTAVSPAIESFYYTNLNLFFHRYMNIEVWDKSFIEVSPDDGNTWHVIWESNSYLSDFQWEQKKIAIPNEYSRTDKLRIRFRLGPTDGQNSYSGWNIDDVYLTGEFLSKDVGVSAWVAPQTGSGYGSEESVTIKVRNYGGAEITDPVPVAYSFNGGVSWTIDTLNSNIPVGDSVEFNFPTKVDLTTPGLRPSVLAKTLLPGDQYPDNDELRTSVYIVPTYIVPYREDFETNEGFWTSSGNKVWEYGSPAGLEINSASSGSHAWTTGIDRQYGDIIAEKYRIIFEDDFETDNGWSMTGEFERNIPSNMHLPYFAYSGFSCLGTDLSGQGANPYLYENGINTSGAHTATSPPLDVSAYSNIKVSFAGWLMIETGDSVKLEVSPDNGSSWITLWKNTQGTVRDFDYSFQQFLVDDSVSSSSQMRFRFSLFHSSASGSVAEGWNIDDFMVTGDLLDNSSAYLTSPNYDLRGIEMPVLEADLWLDTEQGVDGATLLYSLDDGKNWIPLTNSTSFDNYWNWYTGDHVQSIGRDGWSGQTGGWKKVKHLLPVELINQPNVRFRLEFAADKFNNEYDGIAWDNVEIKNAPFDVGINEIVNPVSACELGNNQQFTVRMQNYGIRNMAVGDTIIVGYFIDKEGLIQQKQEKMVLTAAFPAGDVQDFTLNSEFDFSRSGDYLTQVFIVEEDPYYYQNISNDTVEQLVSVRKPSVNLGPDLATVKPDTVILSASDGMAGNTYLWQDGSINPEYHVSGEGIYYVRVSNSLGCISSDTLEIMKLNPDAGINSLISPVSDCEIGSDMPIRVTVENFGNDTLSTGDTIFIEGSINEVNLLYDTLLIPYRFYPGESMEYTLSGLYDFSIPGIYRLKIYTRLKDDHQNFNDTLTTDVEAFFYPEINLGPDTVVSGGEYLLTPGAGYNEYIWQDGSTGEDYVIDTPGTGYYHVNVSDIHGCSSSDSVRVTLNTTDLSLSQVLSPGTQCNPSENLRVSLRLKNTGNQVISSGESISLGYTIDGGAQRIENLTLTGDLLPGMTTDKVFTGTENLQTNQWYDFEFYLDYARDMKLQNDTLYMPVGIFPPPVVDLGGNFQVITGLEYTLDAGPGYSSYLWQDGSTNQTYQIGEPGIGEYAVTVTDANGCPASDTVEIMLAVPDVGILEVDHPRSSCGPGSSDQVRLAVKNFGTWDIETSAEIKVYYTLNGGEPVTETLVLNAPFEKGSVLYHTFSVSENINSTGHYELTAGTIYAADLVPSNDSVTVGVDIYNTPAPDIGGGMDTLVIYEPLILNVPEGFVSYEWQDGSTGETYLINDRGAGYFSVTVTDENGCSASDSIYVIHDLPDLAIERIRGPVSACSFNKNTIVVVDVVNNGFNQIEEGESIPMSYSVNHEAEVPEMIILESPLQPGEVRRLSFATPHDFSANGEYLLRIKMDYPPDSDPSNDSISSIVSNWGYPEVDLGEGKDTIHSELPVLLDAGSGYGSYYWQDNSGGSIYEAHQYGSYFVTVGNGEGCMTTDTVVIAPPLASGMNSLDVQQIRIYPNPAHDYLHVEMEIKGKQDVVLEIYNLNNQIILQRELPESGKINEEINVSDLNYGMYFLRIRFEGQVYVYRFVVN